MLNTKCLYGFMIPWVPAFIMSWLFAIILPHLHALNSSLYAIMHAKFMPSCVRALMPTYLHAYMYFFFHAYLPSRGSLLPTFIIKFIPSCPDEIDAHFSVIWGQLLPFDLSSCRLSLSCLNSTLIFQIGCQKKKKINLNFFHLDWPPDQSADT